MALMMRSHSSTRVREPHSPSTGTYSSSFCSSSVSGTLKPNSSGNVAIMERWWDLIKRKKNTWTENVCPIVRVCIWKTHHRQGQAPCPMDSSSQCLRCPSCRRKKCWHESLTFTTMQFSVFSFGKGDVQCCKRWKSFPDVVQLFHVNHSGPTTKDVSSVLSYFKSRTHTVHINRDKIHTVKIKEKSFPHDFYSWVFCTDCC